MNVFAVWTVGVGEQFLVLLILMGTGGLTAAGS
jgi:hypothetical protein